MIWYEYKNNNNMKKIKLDKIFIVKEIIDQVTNDKDMKIQIIIRKMIRTKAKYYDMSMKVITKKRKQIRSYILYSYWKK